MGNMLKGGGRATPVSTDRYTGIKRGNINHGKKNNGRADERLQTGSL